MDAYVFLFASSDLGLSNGSKIFAIQYIRMNNKSSSLYLLYIQYSYSTGHSKTLHNFIEIIIQGHMQNFEKSAGKRPQRKLFPISWQPAQQYQNYNEVKITQNAINMRNCQRLQKNFVGNVKLILP